MAEHISDRGERRTVMQATMKHENEMIDAFVAAQKATDDPSKITEFLIDKAVVVLNNDNTYAE